MSANNLSEKLIEALNKSIDQSAENNKISNERMNELTDTMNSLAKTVERSELRHINHTEGLERVGNQSAETSKKLDTYIKDNNDRVMVVEKQVLLLDESESQIKKRFSVIDKFAIGILSTVAGAGVLLWVGLA